MTVPLSTVLLAGMHVFCTDAMWDCTDALWSPACSSMWKKGVHAVHKGVRLRARVLYEHTAGASASGGCCCVARAHGFGHLLVSTAAATAVTAAWHAGQQGGH